MSNVPKVKVARIVDGGKGDSKIHISDGTCIVLPTTAIADYGVAVGDLVVRGQNGLDETTFFVLNRHKLTVEVDRHGRTDLITPRPKRAEKQFVLVAF